MKQIFTHAIVFLLSVFGLVSIGQSPKKIKLTGQVSANQHPAEAATVSLLSSKDSALVKLAFTDKSGIFEMDQISESQYLLSVELVGFKKYYSEKFRVTTPNTVITLPSILLTEVLSAKLDAVTVVSKKPFIEQKADRMVVNVEASPTSAGSSAMDMLEKLPGVTIDKDGNISLKGKQGVMVMIDNKPTYLSAAELANYLRGLPASALDQIELMTNPSAKYEAAGNSGIINIKTKKNKAGGLNGSLSLTHTQGVYPKPGGSINLNYRTGKLNLFLNGGYNRWENFNELNIDRHYYNGDGKTVNAIFSQVSNMHRVSPESNLKLGMDYYLNKKTTLGFVASGFINNEKQESVSNILLKNASNEIDSMVHSPSTTNNTWKNGSVNINLRHQFDSTGRELTADADFIRYNSSNNQYFTNITSYPNSQQQIQTILSGNLPSDINIYSFKSDYSHPLKHELKLEAGIKTSYISTDNNAGYFNVINGIPEADTAKTNHFLYHENINAAYINLNKQFKKWSIQAGLRLENTNYSGHQLGNGYTVVNKDSSFKRSYTNLFPTVYVSYQLNKKNTLSANYGRRIDRPAYDALNPFLFFLDNYTYQAGSPYLKPQFTQNIELSHTYNNFLTTTLNYSYTTDFFSQIFEQKNYATIFRNGNIGKRVNGGIAVSAQIPATKWWTAILYTNYNYNTFQGVLNGEALHVSSGTFLANINNQFKFKHGWSAELSGWYRSSGLEGQIRVNPMGKLSAAFAKQLFKDKANIKLGIRDLFYTGGNSGTIQFQQTSASFHSMWDSRQVSLSFTWRFGKPLKGAQPRRETGGAGDEAGRVKTGGSN